MWFTVIAMSQHYWVLERPCIFSWICFCNIASAWQRMETWLCCVLFCHCLCHTVFLFPLHSSCSYTRRRGRDSRQGSGVSEGKTITPRPLHHWVLSTESEMKAESYSIPPAPRQILFFTFLCKCLLIQCVHLLVCACLESVHRSLSDTFCWV